MYWPCFLVACSPSGADNCTAMLCPLLTLVLTAHFMHVDPDCTTECMAPLFRPYLQHVFVWWFNFPICQKPVFRTIWIYVFVVQITGGELHNVITEGWIFCVSLATRTCNVWLNKLSRICWSIKRHFKRSFNTLIFLLLLWSWPG